MHIEKRKKTLITTTTLIVIIGLFAYITAPFSIAENGGEYASTTSEGSATADPEVNPTDTALTSNQTLATTEETTPAENSASTTETRGTLHEDEEGSVDHSADYTNEATTSSQTVNDAQIDETTSPDTQTATQTPTAQTQTTETQAQTAETQNELNSAPGDPAAVNVNTGADSTNVSQTNIDNTTEVNAVNNALTYNNAKIKADTGNNNANYNTGSGIISTQQATGDGQIVNVLNLNQIDVSNPSIGPINVENAYTGPDSDNVANVNVNNQLTVRVSNSSNTINKVKATVVSGDNQANYNTGHGILLTGDANMGINFVTMANTNIINAKKFYANWQNIYSDYTGNLDLGAESANNSSPLSSLIIDAANKSTGPNSNNQAIVNVNDQTQIITKNSGKINNEIDASVISGRNRANGNTGTGSVASGDVNSSVNVVNFLNSNVVSSNSWLKSMNVFGDWQGNIVLPKMPKPNLTQGSFNTASGNLGTGADSNNSANVNVNNETNISNSNDAKIANDLKIKTNTGNNETSYNGQSGIVKFGEADAETNELNVANLNVTGDSWWMVVVNRFGQWSGTTVGAPADMIVDGSGNSTLLCPEGSGIHVENSSTGPDSNNEAGANINHTTDISNSNTADIMTKIDLDDISGENETKYNTGHGYVDTGDIRATNNIINFANSNISVGNWMVIVVNVFGNWSGNLVFNTIDASLGDTYASMLSGSTVTGNANTGSDSNNTATANSTANTTVNSNNNSNLNNNTSASSITGQNDANYNTGSGIITTGGANTTSNTTNQANTNNIGVNGVNNNGNTTATNNGTGYDSNNNTNTNTSANTNVDSNNNTSADNNYDAANSTGHNSSNYNTGDGVVDTGWANTYLDLYNQNNDTQVSLGDLVDEFTSAETGGVDTGSNGNTTNTPTNGNSNTSNTGGNTSSGSGSNTSHGLLYTPPANTNLTKATGTINILKGDINADGVVNDLDFSLLMANWGNLFKNKNADLNADSKINDYDLSIIISNWHKRQS